MDDTTMSEEKKNEVTEEVKEKARKLTDEELAQVSGGVENGFRTSHAIQKIESWDYED